MSQVVLIIISAVKMVSFPFLGLHYCITLKFLCLIIVLIVAHFHAIALLSNVMLHFNVT